MNRMGNSWLTSHGMLGSHIARHGCISPFFMVFWAFGPLDKGDEFGANFVRLRFVERELDEFGESEKTPVTGK